MMYHVESSPNSLRFSSPASQKSRHLIYPLAVEEVAFNLFGGLETPCNPKLNL